MTRFSLWFAIGAFVISILACGTAVTQTAYFACPTVVPTPAMPQSTLLPGTPLPPPTLIPLPPTPYLITPPQDFYVGDAVLVGQPGMPQHLHFRLLTIQSQPALPPGDEPLNLHTWHLEISNLGSMTYETMPIALMTITRIDAGYSQLSGTWLTSETAMQDAGYVSENYGALTPGSSRVYRLAAYGPAGDVSQLTYSLDGGTNRITWVNTANPYCGAIAD